MERRIFLRLRHRVKAHTGDIITVGDAAQIAGQQKLKKTVGTAAVSDHEKRQKYRSAGHYKSAEGHSYRFSRS